MKKETIAHEIKWLEREIKRIECNPRKAKQVKEYRRQIKQKELNLSLMLALQAVAK